MPVFVVDTECECCDGVEVCQCVRTAHNCPANLCMLKCATVTKVAIVCHVCDAKHADSTALMCTLQFRHTAIIFG